MYLLGAVNVFSANNTFPVEHQRPGQETVAAHQHQSQRCHHGDRRRDHLHRAGREPGLPWSRLHHRPAPRILEFCRRRAGLGIARSAADFRPWSHHSGFACGRQAAHVDAAGAGDLLLRRAAHRRGRNAGGRFLHFVQDAQAIGRRHGARHHRSEEIRRCACGQQPHRPRLERQGGFCRRGRGVSWR